MSELLSAGDINRLVEETSVASGDFIPIIDVSADKIKKATVDNIVAGADAVDGPSSSTDNAIARFDSTTGKLLQDTSGATINDSFLISAAGFASAPTAGDTVTNFTAYGVITFGSSLAKTYTIDAPTGSGALVALRCTQGGSTTVQTVSIGDTVSTFDGTATNLTFNAADEAVILIDESTIRYGIYSNTNAVGLS